MTGERTEKTPVFPLKINRADQDADLSALLRKLGYAKGTVSTHGMRSSLRTFLPEREKADADVAESALAHDKRNRVQQAYERTRHREARGPLMQAWATYLEPEAVAMPLAA